MLVVETMNITELNEYTDSAANPASLPKNDVYPLCPSAVLSLYNDSEVMVPSSFTWKAEAAAFVAARARSLIGLPTLSGESRDKSW